MKLLVRDIVILIAACVIALLVMLLIPNTANATVSFRAAAQNAINTIPTSTTITHIGTGTPQGITGCGSINPSIPAGVNGDLLIALALAKEDDGGNNVSMSGWNTYYTATYPGAGNNNEMQVRIFWRFATGGDPNTITQSGSSCGGSGLGGQISRFRGVDPSSPFETASPGVVAQDSGNLDTGTINTASATAMLLVAGFVSDNRNVTEVAGWTEAFDFAYNDGGPKPDLGITLNYQLQTTAGSKSISNWDLSGGGNDENIGAILALTPAPLIGAPGLTINVPTGTVAGDVMITSVSARPSSITITPPAGWTLIRQVDQPNANSSVLHTYYRVAAGEPADYTWALSSVGFTGAAGGIASFIGVDTTALPYDDEAGNATPGGTSHTAPSVTTSLNGGMLVTSHEYTSARAWTPPGGMTEVVDVSSLPPNNATGIAIEINYESRPTAGATGTRTASIGGNADVGATQSVSLLPEPPQLLAYYRMDEGSWDGTPGEVLDLSGNNNHGTAVDGISTNSVSPAIPGTPGTCRYAEIPDNNSTNTTEAIDTGVNATTGVGNTGSISFWFKSNDDWNGGNTRQLLDASTTANGQKYFFLQVRDNSRLRFSLEDSNDGDFELETGNNNILADQWVHLAITWDLPNDTLQIYINGSLAAEDTTFNTNGVLGGLDTIYLGDNRSSYFAAGSTRRSANGSIDEARIYDFVQTPAQIQADRDDTHACAVGGFDHFDIISPLTSSVCSGGADITILAKDFLGNTIVDYDEQINLSTSNNRGDWSIVSANGALDNDIGDDGLAIYQFVDNDDGIITLSLDMPVQGTITVTVQDDPSGFSTTSAGIGFRRANRSLLITTDPIQVAGRPQAMTVARLNNSCMIDTNFNGLRNFRVWITRDVDDPNGIAPSINGVSLPNTEPAGNNLTGANRLNFISGEADFNLDTTDVGKYILNMRDGNRSGSSGSITTRPFGLAFTNIQDAGANPNPRGTAGDGITANGFVSAGTVFSATIGAYLWEAGDDGNNNGFPDAVNTNITNNGVTPAYAWSTALQANLDTPAAGVAGTLGGTIPLPLASFALGVSTVTDLTYDEVGSIMLQADATNFLNTAGVNITGTSQSDGSNGIVGRFFPDHFTLQASSITPSCGGTFTYMGEPIMRIAFDLQAQELNNGQTVNYDAGMGYVGTATLLTAAENSNDGTALDTRMTDPIGVWSNGEFNFDSSTEIFIRQPVPPNDPDGPYQNLQISLLIDSEIDNRDIANHDNRSNDNNNCTVDGNCTSKAIGIVTDVRFGRLRVNNAFGSEIVNLSVPMLAEYYDSDLAIKAFVPNTDDNCSALTDMPPGPPIWGDITLPSASYTGELTEGETAPTFIPFVNGVASIDLSAPGSTGGVPNTGSVDLMVDVSPWLEFDWDNTDGMNDGPYDDEPSATATFGIFRGNDSTIYLRELY